MKDDLVVNPFLQIQFYNEQECEYFLVTPKPQTGLQYLKISESEKPNLFEIFLDLAKVRFDLLDIEKDLNENEFDLLFQTGVLVKSSDIPQKPLFNCPLSEVETTDLEIDVSSLIANPTFEFQAANLVIFGSWIQEKHLSPFQPSVWIKIALAGIEVGYWLSQEQAEIVSQFKAGEKLPFEIEKNLLSKLIAAEIVVSPEIQNSKVENLRQLLSQAKNDFAQKKYSVLRSILPATQMKAMRHYYREYIKQGFMPFGDSQVNRRYYQHNEPLAKFFHKNLTELMSIIAGEEVKPSYVYAASYKEGAALKPHIDRDVCKFSFSFQVDYLPEQQNHLSPWALYLSTKEVSIDDPASFEWENFPPDAENEHAKAVYLASGDCLVYKGCELTHYRYALPEGHQSTSLFFHYVPADFEGDLN